MFDLPLAVGAGDDAVATALHDESRASDCRKVEAPRSREGDVVVDLAPWRLSVGGRLDGRPVRVGSERSPLLLENGPVSVDEALQVELGRLAVASPLVSAAAEGRLQRVGRGHPLEPVVGIREWSDSGERDDTDDSFRVERLELA